MIVIQNGLMWISAVAATILSVVGLGIWCDRHQVFPGRRLLGAFRRLPWPVQFFLLAFSLHLIVHGSIKTNAVGDVEGDAQQRGRDILVACNKAVSTFPSRDRNVASPLYEIPQSETGRVPANAELAQNWWRRGCWEDWRTVAFEDGWVFPHGSNHLSQVTVMSQGEILASVCDTLSLASLGTRVAHVPFDTCFYHEHTPSNSYRFVWNRAYIERNTNMPMTAAVELFRNGDTCVTTNGVSTVMPYEIPFPHVGIGQDDDWVRANFTNATDILSVGYANWVDAQVGVDLENGLYKFTATFPDDPPEATELIVGDLSVCVTNAGEYVFVLEKGVEYDFGTNPYDAVVEYSMQDDVMDAPVFANWWWGDDNGVWTVDGDWQEIIHQTFERLGRCVFMPIFHGSPNVSHASAEDGEIVMEACLIDAPHAESVSYSWNCDNANVIIDSPHSRVTVVRFPQPMPNWSRASISVEALVGTNVMRSVLSSFSYGTNSIPNPAAVSVSFSKPFVIFESEREVASGVTVLRSSTSTMLTCSASGGENGGHVDFALEGGNKIVCVSGIRLPYSKELAPGEDISFDIVIEGMQASEEMEDIGVTGTLQADDVYDCQTAKLTSVRASTHTYCSWIPYQERRRVGVGEQVGISLEPVEAERLARISGCELDGDFWVYTAADHATEDMVAIDLQTVHYDLVFSVIEPEFLKATDCQSYSSAVIGESGGIVGCFTVVVFPTNVSFTGIHEMEVPCVSTNATGYFAQSACQGILDHGLKGAGRWHGVSSGNVFFDNVSISTVPQPWNEGGAFTWPIPNAWRVAGDSVTTNLFSHRSSYDQRFELRPDGTVSIEKFDYVLMRGTNTSDVAIRRL